MIIFNDIAKKVLTVDQQSISPLLEEFSKTHFLVGGTAIALILGHRKSIDFDFFHLGPQGTGQGLAKRIASTGFILEEGSDLRYLSEEEESEVTLYVKGVKIQLIDFSRNPYDVLINLISDQLLCNGIKTVSLEQLACLKLFAMMYRNKWKDAVDLFYILKYEKSFVLLDLIKKTKEIFTSLYQEIATLETIMNDEWDTTEMVEYVIENPVTDFEIRNQLIELAKKVLETI